MKSHQLSDNDVVKYYTIFEQKSKMPYRLCEPILMTVTQQVYSHDSITTPLISIHNLTLDYKDFIGNCNYIKSYHYYLYITYYQNIKEFKVTVTKEHKWGTNYFTTLCNNYSKQRISYLMGGKTGHIFTDLEPY